jgi:hypothetical protein
MEAAERVYDKESEEVKFLNDQRYLMTIDLDRAESFVKRCAASTDADIKNLYVESASVSPASGNIVRRAPSQLPASPAEQQRKSVRRSSKSPAKSAKPLATGKTEKKSPAKSAKQPATGNTEKKSAAKSAKQPASGNTEKKSPAKSAKSPAERKTAKSASAKVCFLCPDMCPPLLLCPDMCPDTFMSGHISGHMSADILCCMCTCSFYIICANLLHLLCLRNTCSWFLISLRIIFQQSSSTDGKKKKRKVCTCSP